MICTYYMVNCVSLCIRSVYRFRLMAYIILPMRLAILIERSHGRKWDGMCVFGEKQGPTWNDIGEVSSYSRAVTEQQQQQQNNRFHEYNQVSVGTSKSIMEIIAIYLTATRNLRCVHFTSLINCFMQCKFRLPYDIAFGLKVITPHSNRAGIIYHPQFKIIQHISFNFVCQSVRSNCYNLIFIRAEPLNDPRHSTLPIKSSRHAEKFERKIEPKPNEIKAIK